MKRFRSCRVSRLAVGAAVGLLVGMPLSAFFLAPAPAATGTPGEDLAGINATATGTGVQVIPLIRGVVPAGNLATGDFFQVSIPYSTSSATTGPSSSTIATPVWPGPVASSLASALPELGFPNSVAKLLKDPVLAEADYPAEVGAPTSSTYSTPGGSVSGAGTAGADAGLAGSTGKAALSSTSLLGGLVKVGSSTATSSTTVGTASVSDSADGQVGSISILGGLIQIAGISSQASASSDGTNATDSSELNIGAVTLDVAGAKIKAYIGPNGLHLVSANEGALAVSVLNTVLSALNQAGLSVTVVDPTSQIQGNSATVDSGVVEISFLDVNIPNPDGENPVSAAGVDVDLGESSANAQATTLPPIPPFSSSPPPAVVGSTPPGSSLTTPGSTTTPAVTTGPGVSLAQPGSTGSSGVSLPQARVTPTVFGISTRLAWVVIAVILSIIASGPLLGYANWQLLRGRKA